MGRVGRSWGGNEGGETLIRIYCMIKSFLNKKDLMLRPRRQNLKGNSGGGYKWGREKSRLIGGHPACIRE